jgi:hypothetical protein
MLGVYEIVLCFSCVSILKDSLLECLRKCLSCVSTGEVCHQNRATKMPPLLAFVTFGDTGERDT